MTKNAASNASSWIAAVSIRYECRCASTINADTTVSFDVVLNSVREFWYSMYDNMRFLESNTWSSAVWKTAFCWAKISLSCYEIYGQAKGFEHGFRARKYWLFLAYYMNKMHLLLSFCFVQDRSSTSNLFRKTQRFDSRGSSRPFFWSKEHPICRSIFRLGE